MIEACEFELAAENDYYCTTHKVYFKNDSDCPYKHIAELEQQLAALREAAQYAADVICLPGPHDYYHSTQDWEAMKELRAALLKQGEQR